MENKNDYFYENYRLADFYDDQYGTITHDIAFWTSISNEASDILELACGTGRITMPLSEKGREVYAIDYSDEMISILKEKCIEGNISSVKIFNQDMRYLNINKKFDVILITSNSLNHIETNGDLENTLTAIKSHLKDDGTLVFDILNPKFEFLTRDPNKTYAFSTYKHNASERFFNTWENNIYNHKSQINYVNYYYQFCDENGCSIDDIVYKMRMKVRLYFPKEMDYMIEKCGFRIINKYGWYDKREFDGKTNEQIYVLKKL